MNELKRFVKSLSLYLNTLKYDANLIIVEEKPKSKRCVKLIIDENRNQIATSSWLNFFKISAVKTKRTNVLVNVNSQDEVVEFNNLKLLGI